MDPLGWNGAPEVRRKFRRIVAVGFPLSYHCCMYIAASMHAILMGKIVLEGIFSKASEWKGRNNVTLRIRSLARNNSTAYAVNGETKF